MQKASLPVMCTTSAPLAWTCCICAVMSAVPTGIGMTSYSRPAFSMTLGASASTPVRAWGTSMMTNSTLSLPSLSATDTGRPNRVVSGLMSTKLDCVSAVMPWPLVWNHIVGTPAACSGSHTESATADWLRATATTPSSTNWLAQSVAPAGSAPVSHVTTSIGRPPTPALWALK